jgi:hypothetical protein
MGGRGVTGTVTAIAPGSYTIKTETGETYKVTGMRMPPQATPSLPRNASTTPAPPTK